MIDTIIQEDRVNQIHIDCQNTILVVGSIGICRSYASEMVYKNKIKNVVFKYEEFCWKVTMSLLYDVPHYAYCVPDIRIHPWWNFVKNIREWS